MPSLTLTRASSLNRSVRKTSIPIEVMDRVVLCLLEDRDDDRCQFSNISSFSLTCYRFRQLALKRYFVVLRATTKFEWYSRCRIPGVSTWTRTIQCHSNALYVCPGALAEFTNLQSATISFHTEGRNIQHTSTRRILTSMPTTVTHLALEYLPLVDANLIALVAAALPGLVSLHLSCSERLAADMCCWNCFAEAGSWTMHSPLSDHICDVYALTDAFGQALKPLRKLEDLFFGIYLSDEEVLYQHIAHADAADDPHGPDECPLCECLHAEYVRDVEMLASAELARGLPELKIISWSTFFAMDRPGDDPELQKTTMWVKREAEGVVVKRSEWV